MLLHIEEVKDMDFSNRIFVTTTWTVLHLIYRNPQSFILKKKQEEEKRIENQLEYCYR